MAGVLPRRKTKQMTEKQLIDLGFQRVYVDENADIIDEEFYELEYKDILDALNEAKKMYAEEIEKALKKVILEDTLNEQI
jgi:hypothetical protein